MISFIVYMYSYCTIVLLVLECPSLIQINSNELKRELYYLVDNIYM